MKFIIISIILILVSYELAGFTIPYSDKELRSESNHLSGFVRISPDDSKPIPLTSDAWLWHDGDNLYVEAECETDENFDKGRLGSADEWVDCDFFRIQIITDVKNYYAYMFYSFPLENHYDCVRNPGMNIDTGWNSDYENESTFSGNIWKSKMTIPFKDLRFWGNPPYEWKIILTRYFHDDEDFYSFPYGTIEMGKDYYRTAYDVRLEEEITKNRNYKVSPYFVKKYDLIEKKESFDPDNVGLNFSYNPTSATKLKLSFNPDFSDIPMDNLQNNFNERYEPSFCENRYFFIEDINVFGVDNNIFYSRHIRQPQYAVKLTGNSEHFSYGFLSAMDKEVKEDGEVVHDDDIYNLLAFKPKWKNLDIQMTLLNRMNKDYHNEVLVINPRWEFRQNQTVWTEIDLSYKDNTEQDKRKGYTFNYGYNGEKGDFDWSINGCTRSKDFDTDMGLLYIRHFSAMNVNISYDSEPERKFLKIFGSGIWYHKTIDNASKDMIEENGGINFWMNSQQKFNFNMNLNMGQEEYNGTIYDWNNIWTSFSIWQIDWLSASISYNAGQSIIFSLEQNADKDNVNYSLFGDISDFISYQLSTQKQRYFGLPDSCGVDDQYWIGNIDLTFNFTNKFSLTNGLRYNDYETEWQSAYLGFFSNISYEFKDQCYLFLGYKSVQDEIDEEYIIDYRQAYLKVRYTF